MRRACAVVVAAMCVSGSAAYAQSGAGVTLRPENPARWDAAFQIGWLRANKSGIAPEWDRWSDAASFSGFAGYYFTPHLKGEIDVTQSTQGRISSYPFGVSPIRPRQDEFRTTTVNGMVSYQFLENTWFHPFVGAGLDVVRESSRVTLPEYVVWTSPTVPVVRLPAQIGDWQASTHVWPMATAGFKWYATERAFIRSDIRTALSSRQAESFAWRVGVGVDF